MVFFLGGGVVLDILSMAYIIVDYFWCEAFLCSVSPRGTKASLARGTKGDGP